MLDQVDRGWLIPESQIKRNITEVKLHCKNKSDAKIKLTARLVGRDDDARGPGIFESNDSEGATGMEDGRIKMIE